MTQALQQGTATRALMLAGISHDIRNTADGQPGASA